MKFTTIAGLGLAAAVLLGIGHYSTVYRQDPVAEKLAQRDYVDQQMRNAGFCRWWLLMHNLPDRGYDKPSQVPDPKFRRDMNRRCPDAKPEFVGPHTSDYYEDRKRWKKEFGKYPEWKL